MTRNVLSIGEIDFGGVLQPGYQSCQRSICNPPLFFFVISPIRHSVTGRVDHAIPRL